MSLIPREKKEERKKKKKKKKEEEEEEEGGGGGGGGGGGKYARPYFHQNCMWHLKAFNFQYTWFMWGGCHDGFLE